MSTACSGAGIEAGIVGPYWGIQGVWREALPSQIDQVLELLRDHNGRVRPVDLLYLQAGANDAGFGEVTLQCALPPPVGPCYDVVKQYGGIFDAQYIPFSEHIRWKVSRLRELYETLHGRLRERLPSYDPARTIISGYHDPTHAPDGSYCEMTLYDAAWTLNGHISEFEASWAYNAVIVPLNDTVTQAAGRHRWNLVDDIDEAFHPNAAGQEYDAQRLVNAVGQ